MKIRYRKQSKLEGQSVSADQCKKITDRMPSGVCFLMKSRIGATPYDPAMPHSLISIRCHFLGYILLFSTDFLHKLVQNTQASYLCPAVCGTNVVIVRFVEETTFLFILRQTTFKDSHSNKYFC